MKLRAAAKLLPDGLIEEKLEKMGINPKLVSKVLNNPELLTKGDLIALKKLLPLLVKKRKLSELNPETAKMLIAAAAAARAILAVSAQLNSIKHSSEKILDFLEQSKESSLSAGIEYLLSYVEELAYLQDPMMIQAKQNTCEMIQKESLANI